MKSALFGVNRLRGPAGRCRALMAARSSGSVRGSATWSRSRGVPRLNPAFKVTSPLMLRQCLSSGTFLSGTSGPYIDEMYRQWKSDPSSVHKSWDAYFRTGTFTAPPSEFLGGSASSSSTSSPSTAGGGVSATSGNVDARAIEDAVRVIQMVRAFQVRGHFKSKLDPLGIVDMSRRGFVNPQELELSHYGFSDKDLDRRVPVRLLNTRGFLGIPSEESMTIREIYNRLTEVYSGTVGVEYMHIHDVEKCNWIRDRLETQHKAELSKDQRLLALHRLVWADRFENFLKTKHAAAKRFGLEGGESTIPCLRAMIDTLAVKGVNSIVMGMPHRGRLNVLANVLGKPLEQIFSGFSGQFELEEEFGQGDVKYHLGMSGQCTVNDGDQKRIVRLSLLANPSHLETVDPVVLGKARAKQTLLNGGDDTPVASILLHGDAAFAGQGVVYESLGMNDLPAYAVGGTIHVVVNNQIGFTTDPTVARSSAYSTDIAKCVGAPIFHVNADDPEAVVEVSQIAADWRQQFKRDVVIDLVCYRRHGHNEVDEPRFTQPRMYEVINKRAPTMELYAQSLIDRGDITKEEFENIKSQVEAELHAKYEESQTYEPSPQEWLHEEWTSMKEPSTTAPDESTGVAIETLQEIGKAISSYPDEFNVLQRLQRILQDRQKAMEAGTMDWGTAEALAFGSLLLENIHVRLSGQDVERGTFSHRHAVLHDQKDWDRAPHIPLQHLKGDQAMFSISNSHLSEYAVLGFEYGYASENPRQLVLWEAQFGDFSNGAQIMIDQYIAAAEAKWRRQSGLVMLLPHGYEGQGSEHSSARLERYLQLADDNPLVYPDYSEGVNAQMQRVNIQVINATTPANYFHALRRQIHRDFRKPLIVMSPKSLLRDKEAVSSFEDMGPGTRFQRLIPETNSDDLVADGKIRRVILSAGKVYYDLRRYRTENKIKDIALVRVEQICPFPFDLVDEQLKKYSKAEVVWCQEEPMNMGSWSYVEPRIETASHGKRRASYVGRRPSAAPASGFLKNHEKELREFLDAAFAK